MVLTSVYWSGTRTLAKRRVTSSNKSLSVGSEGIWGMTVLEGMEEKKDERVGGGRGGGLDLAFPLPLPVQVHFAEGMEEEEEEKDGREVDFKAGRLGT